MTMDEFREIANGENPEGDPKVVAWMKTNGLSFETKGRGRVIIDGEKYFFVTDPEDFGTILTADTERLEGLTW